MKSPENATKRFGIESLCWLARSAVFVIGTICFSAILEDRLLLALDQRLYPIQAISSGARLYKFVTFSFGLLY